VTQQWGRNAEDGTIWKVAEEFDYEQRLTRVRAANGDIIVNEYDAMGARLKELKTSAGSTTQKRLVCATAISIQDCGDYRLRNCAPEEGLLGVPVAFGKCCRAGPCGGGGGFGFGGGGFGGGFPGGGGEPADGGGGNDCPGCVGDYWPVGGGGSPPCRIYGWCVNPPGGGSIPCCPGDGQKPGPCSDHPSGRCAGEPPCCDKPEAPNPIECLLNPTCYGNFCGAPGSHYGPPPSLERKELIRYCQSQAKDAVDFCCCMHDARTNPMGQAKTAICFIAWLFRSKPRGTDRPRAGYCKDYFDGNEEFCECLRRANCSTPECRQAREAFHQMFSCC
jgi:hypothetical protein